MKIIFGELDLGKCQKYKVQKRRRWLNAKFGRWFFAELKMPNTLLKKKNVQNS